MVLFHVVDNKVVDLGRLDHMGQAAEHGVALADGHGVNQGVLFVPDEVGIVGCAFGALGIAVEIVMIVVDTSDPVGIFCNFNCVHKTVQRLFTGDASHRMDRRQPPCYL